MEELVKDLVKMLRGSEERLNQLRGIYTVILDKPELLKDEEVVSEIRQAMWD